MLLLRFDPRWPDAWDSVSEFYERALLETCCEDFNTSDLFDMAVRGEAQTWAAVNEQGEIIGAALISLIVTPKRKIMNVPVVGTINNTIEEWAPLIEVIMRMAKDAGCHAVKGGGRKGWGRMLRSRGYSADDKYEIEIRVQ